MVLDLNIFKTILLNIAKTFKENEKELCLLDSNIGDGDHGVAMVKIAHILENKCSAADKDISISKLFDDIGFEIINSVGGSSGMLWGTYFAGLGQGAMGFDLVDATLLKRMFASAKKEITQISEAKTGDKTMMDAILPATEAVMSAEGDIADILRAAAAAAGRGADETAHYVAKYGRAKNLKEGSLGFKDAGAVSAAMFFEVFEETLQKLG